jgi:hypothetical protein
VVTVELYFAAVSAIESIAHAEAVERLERAVARAGGVINLHTCRSLIGRASAPGRPARRTKRREAH